MDYSVANEDSKPELPQWRVELSRRFQEIKNKKEGGVATAPESGLEGSPQPAVAKELVDPPNVEQSSAPPPPQPKRPRTNRPVNRPEIKLNPAAETSRMPLFEPPRAPEPAREPAADMIQEMIDRAVAKQAPAQVPVDAAPLATAAVTRAAEPVAAEPEPLNLEARLILLSRTLSGLVDLIVIVFCAAAFVIAADSVAGVETLDGRSIVHYGMLLLATFFLYSIFFLFTGNQTIGMMITDLCVVDVDGVRPRMAHIVSRCALYLVSLLGAGIGLLWGCFDNEARCLHDRYSGTRVVRLTR